MAGEQGLRRGVLTLWDAFAQGLGTNGPAAVTALFFVSLAGIVGGSLPLVVTLSFLIYLGMTLITYEWSKEVASAYSWAAYHRKAFNRAGRFLSFYAGTTYYYYYLLGYTGFAVLGLSSFLYVIFPGVAKAYPWLWIPITLAVIAETSALNYLGIKPSMRYVLYTGLAEIAFLIGTSIALLVVNHSSISPVAFTAQPIGNSATTLLVAMVLGIATFGGLNTVVPVAEETRNPKKNVPLALALLATILGLAIILNCYSQTISYGIADMFNYAGLSDPGIIIYAKFLGPAVAAVFAVFIVNSFNSSGVSFETAAVRTSYAFARDGILFPQWMARVNRHGAPGRMVIFNGALAAVIAIVSGIVLGPLTAGVFLIISNSIFSLSNHAIAGIGLTAYHRRKGDLRALVHTVIPVLVAAAIAVAIFYTVYPAPPAPLNYSAWIAGIYLAAIVITYLAYRNRSTAIERVGEFSL